MVPISRDLKFAQSGQFSLVRSHILLSSPMSVTQSSSRDVDHRQQSEELAEPGRSATPNDQDTQNPLPNVTEAHDPTVVSEIQEPKNPTVIPDWIQEPNDPPHCRAGLDSGAQ